MARPCAPTTASIPVFGPHSRVPPRLTARPSLIHYCAPFMSLLCTIHASLVHHSCLSCALFMSFTGQGRSMKRDRAAVRTPPRPASRLRTARSRALHHGRRSIHPSCPSIFRFSVSPLSCTVTLAGPPHHRAHVIGSPTPTAATSANKAETP